MAWAISTDVLADIVRHAATSPDEVCGLLLGDDGRVVAAVPTSNVAADPSCRFEIDPVALFAAHRAARTGGDRVVGHYHSHPSGDASPSRTDAAMAHDQGALWLIVGGDRIAAFVARSGGSIHGSFEPVSLTTPS